MTRARANGKPVIAMKVGGSAVGAAAAASHTASLAGSDAIYDAAFRQLGVERATSPEDLIEIAYACTRGRLPRSRRLAVLTVSGGAGVLMADAAEREGVELTPLSPRSQAEIIGWVPFAAPRNPVDLTAQPLNEPRADRQGLRPAARPREVSGDRRLLSLWASSPKMGEILFNSVSLRGGALSRPLFRPVGDRFRGGAPALRRMPEWRSSRTRGVPSRRSPRRCAAPSAWPSRPHQPRRRSHGLPPLPEGRIGEYEAKRLLAACGIPAVEERLVTSAAEAAAAAAALGDRLVLKIASPDITHKTEVGGVLLDVADRRGGERLTSASSRRSAGGRPRRASTAC